MINRWAYLIWLLLVAPGCAVLSPEETADGPEGCPGRATAKWVALDNWSRTNGFGPVERLTLAPQATVPLTNGFRRGNLDLKARLALIPLPAFAVHTPEGEWTVQSGTRIAHWNGVAFQLGFIPQLLQGQLFLHPLDLQKNVEPLLRKPRLVPSSDRVIVLDPAFGGTIRGGSNSFNGRWEKDLTLDWALRLEQLLASHGWRVFLTRTNDQDLSLEARAATAEQHRAMLFLGLRFSPLGTDEIPQGVKTYCLTPTGLNSTSRQNYFSEDQWVSYPNNNFDAENWYLAFQMQRALLQTSHVQTGRLRRTRQATELHPQNRPALLVAGGNLEIPDEARQIARDEYRQELARVMAEVLDTAFVASVAPAGQ